MEPYKNIKELQIYDPKIQFSLWYGRNELELLDQEMGFSQSHSEKVNPPERLVIWHGSPISPNGLKIIFKNAGTFNPDFIALKPNQPYRINPETKIKEEYGQPGVSAGELKEAIGRSFLHGRNPSIRKLRPDIIVSGIPDAEGASFAFTPLSVVQALAKSKAKGYTYALDFNNGGFERVNFDNDEDASNDLNEHRSYGLVVPMAAYELAFEEINEDIVAVEGGLEDILAIREEIKKARPVGINQMLEVAKQHTNSMLIHEAI